jgi:RNA polymerase sigma-70 factor (ECF subfamily)
MLQASREDSLIQKLIEGCRNNKLKCQEMLYKHFFGYALTIAVRYTGSRCEAIEVVDDSFMKVFDKIILYNNEQSFKGWLRKIVINTAIDKNRKQQGRNIKEKKINGRDVLSNATNDTDSGLYVTELLELIRCLPYLHRSVFNLFEIEGFSHKEIAELLQIPESSSRTYLTRAKRELRGLYKKYFQ